MTRRSEAGEAGAGTIPRGARRSIAEAAGVLAGVPPFSELSPVDRSKLAAALEEVIYGEGEVIFSEGTEPDGLYILREGLIERLSGGVRLATLEPPTVFGDLALLRDERRSTTLMAATPCVVWRLPAARFTRLLSRTPGIGARFAAAVSNRLAATQKDVARLSQDFEALAERLYAGLSPSEQEVLEHAALPDLLPRSVIHRLTPAPMDTLPLADVLLSSDPDQGVDPVLAPSFRRFLLRRLEDRVGITGLANARREVAAAARAAGRPDLAIQILLDGGLAAEAKDLAHRDSDLLEELDLTRSRRLGTRTHGAEEVRAGTISELAEPLPRDLGAPPEAAVKAEGRRVRPGRRTIGLLASGLLLGLGWLLPPPEGLSPMGWHALVALIAVVPLLALEALPEGIVALVLAAVWVVGGVAPPRVALGGFASGTWVLVVTVLTVGAAVAATGLLYRLALLTVAATTRGGFGALVGALGVAGLAASPTVPNATGRVALIAPAAAELVETLGYVPGSRPAAGLAMAVFAGFGQMVAPFLTSSSTALVVFAVLPESARANLSWGTWALRALPTHALLLGCMLLAIYWLYRPRGSDASKPPARAAGVELQRALLGPMSRHEWTGLAVSVALLLGFVTQPLHGVDPAWLGVLALGFLAVTGVMGTDGLRAINWGFVLLVGVLASMVDVFATVGVDRWAAALVTYAVGDLARSPVPFVAALTVLCFAVSFVLRWQAAAPLLTIGLTPVAMSAGIDPWVVAIVTIVACNGFFLPYQSTIYLAMYHSTGSGRLFGHHQARPAALAYGAISLMALCASVPIWQWMGLL